MDLLSYTFFIRFIKKSLRTYIIPWVKFFHKVLLEVGSGFILSYDISGFIRFTGINPVSFVLSGFIISGFLRFIRIYYIRFPSLVWIIRILVRIEGNRI